jgi:hypothetical protein
MKPIMKILLTAIIIQIALLMGCDLANPPQDALRQFFRAVNLRDYESAKLHCTGKMAQGYILGQELENWCAADNEGDMNIKILNVDIHDKETYVVFKLFVFGEGDDEKEIRLGALLVKREGKWLVDEINQI